MERLQRAWEERVATDDTVLLVGDIDWAVRLEDAQETLNRLHSWPGRKILVRGNHDYWWSSKTTGKVRKSLPSSLELLHNNVFAADGFNICGAKGSPVPGGMDWNDQNAKLLNREEQRLRISLSLRDPNLPTIAAIHYPPFYPSTGSSIYRDILKESLVSCVVYGHLHGRAAGAGPHGCHDGIEYRLVAGDAIGFGPMPLATDGRLIPYSRGNDSGSASSPTDGDQAARNCHSSW